MRRAVNGLFGAETKRNNEWQWIVEVEGEGDREEEKEKFWRRRDAGEKKIQASTEYIGGRRMDLPGKSECFSTCLLVMAMVMTEAQSAGTTRLQTL